MPTDIILYYTTKCAIFQCNHQILSLYYLISTQLPSVWTEYMCIPICHINTLVSHTIRDGDSRKSHVNEQTDVAMSDSVESYSLHSADSTTTAYFMMQIRFREREDTVIFVKLQQFYIRLHLVGVEIRHKHTANAFLGFRRCTNCIKSGNSKAS